MPTLKRIRFGVWIVVTFGASLPALAENVPNRPKAKAGAVVTKTVAAKTVVSNNAQVASAAVRGKALLKKTTAQNSDAWAWTKSAPGWTRALHAADGLRLTSYADTVALALDGQYLVVPWSFITETWLARSDAHFYLDDPKQEVFLTDVDLAANMALLKVSTPLIPSYNRGQIRLDSPRLEEPLLILASRDWIRPGGRVLRTKSDGVYTRFQIAATTQDQANAQYVFDRNGGLVAIGGGSEKLWSSSAKSLFDLLRRQDGPHPASVSTSDQRRRQLYYWQERWAHGIVPNRGSFSLQPLDCQAYVASIAEQSLATQVRSVKALDCEGRFQLQLGAGYSAGVRLWTGEAMLRGGGEGMSDKLVQAFSAEAFADLNKSAALVNLMTVPDCSETNVVNQKGQSVRVRFCTTALKVEPGLSDTAVSVSSLDTAQRAYFAVARLKGFDQMNTKKVIEALVENIRSPK